MGGDPLAGGSVGSIYSRLGMGTCEMKMWRAVGGICVLLILSLLLLEPATADENENSETVIAFRPVPSEKVALVRALMCLKGTVREDLENGTVSISKDIKYAEILLHDGSRPAIFILNEGRGWCGTEGCGLNVWEFDGKDWRNLLGTLTQASPGNDALRVQKATDHGYHRLVERRETGQMGSNGTIINIIPLKPIHYMWTGETYDDDDEDEDRPQ